MPVSMQFHGLMPRNNPILGTFQHAPSARNARSKYFQAEITSPIEYERLKALRQNPFTGQFHKGPKQFSSLHGLNRFRASSEGSMEAAELDLASCGRVSDAGDLIISSMNSVNSTPCGGMAASSSANDLSSLCSSDVSSAEGSSLPSASASQRMELEFDEERKDEGAGSAAASAAGSEAGSAAELDVVLSDDVAEFGLGRERYAGSETDAAPPGLRRSKSNARDVESPTWGQVSGAFEVAAAGIVPLSGREACRPSTPLRKRCLSSEHQISDANRLLCESASLQRAVSCPSKTAGKRRASCHQSFGSPRAARPASSLRRTATNEEAKPLRSGSQGDELGAGQRRASASSIEHALSMRTKAPDSTNASLGAVGPASSGSSGGATTPSNISSYDEDIEQDPLDETSDNPWLVNRTVEVTGKYKVDMTREGCLGKGAYSLAKVCRNRLTGLAYAVKIVKKRMLVSQEEKDMIKREVAIHQVLRHRHIIGLHEIFEDENRLFLVMERANAGTLEQLLGAHGGRLPEAQCQYLFKQLLQAIAYLHENGVLQGDLKPANVLLQRCSSEDLAAAHGTAQPKLGGEPLCSWSVKLCDFGLSRKVPDVKYYKFTGDVHKVPFTNLCGTMGYVAPEILRRESYTVAADTWSAGIILFEMLGGIRPFVPYKDCLSVPVAFPDAIFEAISSAAKSVVRGFLQVDPQQRLAAKAALRDEWIENSLPALFSPCK